MKVLYIGPKRGNAYIQYLTLKEIYKKVDLIDQKNMISEFFQFTLSDLCKPN